MFNKNLFVKKIAHAISFGAQPSLVSIFSFLSLQCIVNPSLPCKWFLLLGGIVGIFPFIIMYIYARDYFFKYLSLERLERTKPFILGILGYFCAFLIAFFFSFHFILIAFLFCYFLNTIVLTIINFYWKISVHTSVVATSLTLIVSYLDNVYALLLFLLILPVAWSRYILRYHTKTQVVLAAFLSILFTWLELQFLSRVLYFLERIILV